MTRQQKVLELLVIHANDSLQMVCSATGELTEPGWVPEWEFASPAIGGSEGKRRLREVRAKGIPILQQNFKKKSGKGYYSAYKLGCDPSVVDVINKCKKEENS